MIPSLLVNDSGPGEAQIARLDLIVSAQTAVPAVSGRLGVLGGGYNPITRAHLLLARAAVEQFDLHEVIFVLSKIPPHKPLFGASIEQRLDMMRLGIADAPYISVGFCTHGLFLDICTALKKVYAQNPELYFITGRDAAERLLSWPYSDPAQAIEQMFDAFQLLVCSRHGKLTLPENPMIQQYRGRIHTLRLPENLDHISSTRVRQRTGAGQPIEELVPAGVADFIRRHKLYAGHSED
jgi:nicotinate-nucleotide adenylyltransferase